MHKYIGRRVEIIYQSADGRLSQRVVRVLGVQDGVVRAFCEASGAPRTFRADSILASLPAGRSHPLCLEAPGASARQDRQA